MSSVVIVVPVLGRPARVGPLITNVHRATRKNYRLLFVATEGDEAEIRELQAQRADFVVTGMERRSWACKVNDAVGMTDEEWIFTGADDLRFREGWFERALAWAEKDTRVIGTNDICNAHVMCGDHSTHSLFRRDYVEKFGTVDEPGKVFHEGYGHAWADNEAVATAKVRGVYVHAFDSIVEHLHPLVNKAEDDATYRLGRGMSMQGKKLFHQREKLWKADVRSRAAVKRQERVARGAERTAGRRRKPEKAVVITASYGGYDAYLRAPAEQTVETRFVCVTDDKTTVRVEGPWEVVEVPARFEVPRLAAKVPKMLPGLFTDVTDVIWIDASHEVVSKAFVEQALASRKGRPLTAYRHPRRRCIYGEIDALLGKENQGGLYFDRPLEEQRKAYEDEGYPKGNGLYACGTLAWDLSHPLARGLGEAWLEETAKWSHQDQVELPVVSTRLGVEVGVFPLAQLQGRTKEGAYYNRWLRIWPHARPEVEVG